MKGQMPDWKLKVLNKTTGKYGAVGVGRNCDNGSISISLNPCVVLDASDDHIVITLFPVDDGPPPKTKRRKGDSDDDIPF